MKKLIVAGLLLAGLTACTTTTTQQNANTTANEIGQTIGTVATNIGKNIFTQAVDMQCRSQLNEQSAYKLVTNVMSEQQKKTLEDNVCGCVSKKAPDNVTLAEITTAALNANARTELAGKVIVNTLSQCANDFMGNMLNKQ